MATSGTAGKSVGSTFLDTWIPDHFQDSPSADTFVTATSQTKVLAFMMEVFLFKIESFPVCLDGLKLINLSSFCTSPLSAGITGMNHQTQGYIL
jgi:hypothetical protein